MKTIIYIDMNAFFVSCHQVINPTLQNKIVIVSTPSRRAVVCSASYEARKYNIKSGMPLYQAKILCPQGIYLNVNHQLYLTYSEKIFTFLQTNFTNLIVKCSIDEYCLDITTIFKKYGTSLQCAKIIQKQLLTTFNLPCSIGISFTKSLAKIASKLKKPQGITTIMQKDLTKILFPLPIENLNGIGPKTAQQLKNININTINDLVNSKEQTLFTIFGKRYLSWVQQALGKSKDELDINNNKPPQSIGKDRTLEYDSNNKIFLTNTLKKLVAIVFHTATEKKVTIKTIVCGIKLDRQHWVSKQITLKNNSCTEKIFYETIVMLFEQIWTFPQKIRALRVAVKITL